MSVELLETTGGSPLPHRFHPASAPSLRWLAMPTATGPRNRRSHLAPPTNHRFDRGSRHFQEFRRRDRIAVDKPSLPAPPATSGARKPCLGCPSERSRERPSKRILNANLASRLYRA